MSGRVPWVFALAWSVLLAGCAAHEDKPGDRTDASKPGPETGTVVAVLSNDPQTLSPIGKTDVYSATVASLVSDSLFRYERGLRLVPRLAQRYEISADGRTFTFWLRPGVRWHDGRPVTAEDVEFSVRCARDPRNESLYLDDFRDLSRLEALDPLTVRAEYSVPYADALEGWTLPLVPAHVTGGDTSLLEGPLARMPVGCGPFRLARYEPGRAVVLEANPEYWDGAPGISRLVFSIVPDRRTAYQALLAGEISLLALTPELWAQAEREPRAASFTRLLYHPLRVWHIGWNQRPEAAFFGDARVRRALILALDRESFNRSVLRGLGRTAATTYHPDSPWADPGVRPWPYDPARARALLDEAGWSDRDGDGVREREGRPFEFTLLTASADEVTERMAEWMQQSWREVGVAMRVERLEWRAFLQRRNAGRFDAAMSSLSLGAIPDQYELYHSEASPPGGLNYFGLADRRVDALLETGRRTFDPERRRAIYAELQHLLHELEPISCLYHFAEPILYDSRLEGLRPSALGLFDVFPGPQAWHWRSGAAE